MDERLQAQGGEVEDDTLTAYHASPRQLDEFKPSTFRGSTFFSATPKGALSGALAGMNEMIMETATEGYKGPMHLHEVAIDPSVIRGLHYTPKEKDWFHSLPKRVVGDDDLEGAMRAKPNPYIAWDDVYEPNKIREGLYEYVRREAPPSLTYEQARKTGRDVYGQQHSHYAPDGDEKAAAQNVLKSGMKGYLVQDEGGLSIAMADPSHAKIKRVGRFAQGGEVERNFSPVPGLEAYHEDPAFQEWFGNSVTHREGVPVTYYTGTSKDVDFSKFNVGRHGAWFTADPKEASDYAKENDSRGYKRDGWNMVPTNTASRVIPAHLKIENPYTGPRPDWVQNSTNYKKAQSDWFDTLRAKGHDGWIPEQYGGQLAVVLKEPHQIKTVFNRTWDPKNPRMDKAQGGEVEDDGIAALHSSPHDFDQFMMEKIGTGEGAQAYGHGLYFAESPNVSGQGGQYWNQFFNKMQSGPEKSAAAAMRANKFDRDKALQHLQSSVDFHTKRAAPGSYGEGAEIEEGHRLLADEYRQAAEMLQRGDIAGPRTYEVRINAHPDHFLDWDKPLGEQSEHVKTTLKDILGTDWIKAARVRMNGGELYSNLSAPKHRETLIAKLGSAEDVSKRLHEAGIKGIRYLDAGSRDAGEGSRNYVVFDDKLINVKRKYADGGVVKESSDGKEAREDRAAHGRSRRKTPLIIDQYPTRYMPHVGRQVMQTGGSAIVKHALELKSRSRQRGR